MVMMNTDYLYRMFKVNVKENILKYLGEDFSEAVVVEHKVYKNNQELDGLTVKRNTKTEIAPCFYFNYLYKDFCKLVSEGKTLEESYDKVLKNITESIALSYQEAANTFNNVNFNSIDKTKVIFDLVNTEMNRELLKKVPHREFLDLSIIYREVISVDKGELRSVIIHNLYMESSGLTEAELFDIAFDNTRKIMGVKYNTISEELSGLLSLFDGLPKLNPKEELYILSNTNEINGAANMLFVEEMDKIAEKVDGDLYILPSSKHEVICHYADGRADDFRRLVKETNQQEVSIEDRLSDNVYLYNRRTKQITIA